MRSVWGTKRALRSKEIVLSLLVPGHLVDPRQAGIYQCMCTLRNFVTKRPDLCDMMQRCWQAHKDSVVSAPGPIGLVAKCVTQLGWSWDTFDKFGRPGRSALPLSQGPDPWWQHELRDGLRLARWAIAAQDRHDMQGVDAIQGVDRQATLAPVNSRMDPYDAGLLRGLLCGSIRLRERLHTAGLADSPVCAFCGEQAETLEHCMWHCPRWQQIRIGFQLPDARTFSQWPMCTKACGLFIEDPRVLDLQQNFEALAFACTDIKAFFGTAEVRQSLHGGQVQTVWTDGAASYNQDYRFRRAGVGVFYGIQHDMNMSVALPGIWQSNQRAELLAVVLTCLRDPRPLDIRSDSDYVCKGVAAYQGGSACTAKRDHDDLWRLLESELHTRDTRVCVSWVKGHATEADVRRGRATALDKWGNDGADALAVLGAALHRAPEEVCASGQ